MLPDYDDIKKRIQEPPLWYDQNGVPRYDKFHPSMLGIYDSYAILVRISCQDCLTQFLVSHGWNPYTYIWQSQHVPTMEEVIDLYHYGDPPRHGCTGDTMNCHDHEVVEAWEQAPLVTNSKAGIDFGDRWMRRHEYEIPLDK